MGKIVEKLRQKLKRKISKLHFTFLKTRGDFSSDEINKIKCQIWLQLEKSVKMAKKRPQCPNFNARVVSLLIICNEAANDWHACEKNCFTKE